MSEESSARGPVTTLLGALQERGRRDWSTTLRLGSGLVLFAFVATHLAHHAFGLVSLPVMEAGLALFLLTWTSLPGEAVLAAALGIHLVLVTMKIAQRVTWRMPAVEAVRYLLGLATLTLLGLHVATNYYLYAVREISHGYALYLYRVWPGVWAVQLALLVSAWVHGCIGVHLWLRLNPLYRRIQSVLLVCAGLLPATAVGGLLSAREVVLARAQDPKWVADMLDDPGFGTDVGSGLLRLNLAVAAAILLLVACLFALHFALVRRKRRRGVRLRYPGRELSVPRGATVLEASRMHGIPHASVCGGRGRCSTCRVRVVSGGHWLRPPGGDELRILWRIRAPKDVRLACQIRCERDLEVTPLVPPTVGAGAAHAQGRFLFGTEVDVAILFSDIRRFTDLSERALPYDVVHLLNHYYQEMNAAILAHGGYVERFQGDGMMVLFGLTEGAAAGCRNALAAARDMSVRLKGLNARMRHTLHEPLQIGIGIHVGPAIVGEMGHQASAVLTAVGDTVNTASRVEGLSKKTGTELVITERVARLAHVDMHPFKRYRALVKGKKEALTIYAVPSALDLPESLYGVPRGTVEFESPEPERRVPRAAD